VSAVVTVASVGVAASLGRKSSGPGISVSPTTSSAAVTSAWCVSISREQAIQSGIGYGSLDFKKPRVRAKLVNRSELLTGTDNPLASHAPAGQFRNHNRFWVLELRATDRTFSPYTWTLAVFDADTGALVVAYGGPNTGAKGVTDATEPPYWDALPDHSRACPAGGATATTTTTTMSAGQGRTASAAISYVRQLLAQHRLPHASAVQRVWAHGQAIILSTTLTSEADGQALYDKLATATGCDDRFLFVRTRFVVLRDGLAIDAPRPGYQVCAGT
jgi:hypothetical protein